MLRIVVADGLALVREGLSRLLAQDRELTVVGQSGDDAETLRLVQATTPDLLLLDFDLPPLGGLAALQQMVALPQRPKILILGSTDHAEQLTAMVLAGAKGYFLKQTSSSWLLKAIRAVAEGELWLDRQTLGRVIDELVGFVPSESPTVSPQDVLTDREQEVVRHLARGFKNRQIADSLGISEKTVKSHLTHIFDKLKVDSRLRVALLILRRGLPARQPKPDSRRRT